MGLGRHLPSPGQYPKFDMKLIICEKMCSARAAEIMVSGSPNGSNPWRENGVNSARAQLG